MLFIAIIEAAIPVAFNASGGRGRRMSSPFCQLHGQSSSLCNASSTRSTSCGLRPTDRSFTDTKRMMPSGERQRLQVGMVLKPGRTNLTVDLPLLFQRFTFPLCRQLTVFHALQLDAVGIEKEHGVAVLVVLVRRIDDLHALLIEPGLQGIDVLPVAQFEGIVVQTDVAYAVALAALGRRDPVARLAVRPADGAGI